MKNFNDIQALLERYWEGETSIEEERLLRAYFNSNEVDPRLIQEIPYFKAVAQEQKIQMQSPISMPIQARRINLVWWRAAAAAVVVLGLVGWWLHQPAPQSGDIIAINTAPDTAQPVLIPNNPTHKSVEPKVLAAIEPISKPKAKKVRQRKNTYINAPPHQERITLTPEEEKAFAEVKAALSLLSSKLSRGRKEAIKGAGHLDAFEKVPKAKLNS